MIKSSRLLINTTPLSLRSNKSIFSIPFGSRFISTELKRQLDSIIKGDDVVVFLKGTKLAPQCGFSKAVVQILQIQGVENFKDVNVLANDDLRSGIKEYSTWPTIPQIYIKGEFIGGCDILLNMHKSGELESLLVKEKIVEGAAANEEKAV